MAEQGENEDRTEEATPERREEFRKKGQIAVSREVTSVFVLASVVVAMSFYLERLIQDLSKYMIFSFERIHLVSLDEDTFRIHVSQIWAKTMAFIIPFFIVSAFVACFVTFSQTTLNFSWERLKPDFKRMNPWQGLVRMVSGQAVVELIKGVGKMGSVGIMSYLILYSEWTVVPGLMHYPISRAWIYWADITKLLFWSVSALLLLVAGFDYIYNFASIEKKLKMTKQEVKEEFKKREVDPHVKARMKRMQRDIAMAKAVQATPSATAVITNPTHFAVAIRYELGMKAPIVIAKGQDFTAQRMKEVARDHDIPIVENKPLARTLYKIVKVGQEIPESLYKAVSEVIRYVFLLKGRSLSRGS
ncbi:flagellar biosynthesis protein FlhB [Pseudobacteriovorax antillogorgiicola]|uniref:Flagellar biosynthetic protein FlhB n=1 Tax=Pseudobacteriovorax antillogorgiicola TaxID=1513793 RepID=A0A1Y6CQU1_9BACT|nr:flagellar biosynthesis protein FlhB [Pseudobacteriovorax antillogorgiicola]TCS46657.1 flagellar biosynthetic protein FlhB [Pseudobacteriovorax antillogorgiicola]SMF66483.1 flagellar biosynthetic protein FlhB [Pseudobacteriovorax antillogorgiicola]